jgi:hypothetical protein
MCIDVEPEAREIDSAVAGDWAGVEETVLFFNELRLCLEQATGSTARFCWFFRMDPQIEHAYGDACWAADRYRAAINTFESAGDELGLHTHPWRWDAPLRKWIIDQADQSWVSRCVRSSFEAYRRAFGRDCRTFRFGDRWMNNETMELLESLGVKFDLTIEPGRNRSPVLQELHTGSLPDYTAAPTWPYRPARQDFRKQGGKAARDLWVIPISTGRSWAGRFAALERVARDLGINPRPRDEATPLYLNLPASTFKLMTNDLLATWRKPFLTPLLRSDAGVSSSWRANMEQNAHFLLSHPLVRRFEFMTPAEAIELLS